MIPGRILTSILGAYVFTILPLPTYCDAMRPAWILLCILNMQVHMPQYFRVFGVFILGLCMDALLVTPMGEHAFALIVATWLMINKTQRFMLFSIMQQMLIIGLVCAFYQAILWTTDAALGHHSAWFMIFGVAVSSMLCWPIVTRMMMNST